MSPHESRPPADWPTAQQVREALQAHVPSDLPALPGRSNHLPAPVLVPLLWEPDPVALLTLRAGHLRQHAGEVSFPGGRPEPDDADLQATALREAREELGLEELRVLGRLSTMPLYTSDFRLVPFVAEVLRGELRPHAGEVAAVLRARLREILSAPHIDAIPYLLDGREHLSPIFVLDGHAVYGGTAHTFLELLQVLAPLFGRPVPPLRAGRYEWTDLAAFRSGLSP